MDKRSGLNDACERERRGDVPFDRTRLLGRPGETNQNEFRIPLLSAPIYGATNIWKDAKNVAF
jgi:hypothetical protein